MIVKTFSRRSRGLQKYRVILALKPVPINSGIKQAPTAYFQAPWLTFGPAVG